MNLIDKDAILKTARELSQDIINFERELIRRPSPNPPGEYQVISQFIADKLSTLGFDVNIVSCKPEKPNIIAKLKGTYGKPVLIDCAHMDTVPVGGGWTVDPYEAIIKDGEIYGRGAYDAKARITVYVMATQLIKEAGYTLKGDLINCFTVDEETGGHEGSGYCVSADHIAGDVAILEGPHTEIWYAESGHLTLRIHVPGISAHAMYPWLGTNAIHLMTDVLVELREYQKALENIKSSVPGLTNSTINIGKITGGEKSNMLADSCSIDIDIRVIPEVDQNDVIDRVKQILEKLQRKDAKFQAKMDILKNAPPSASSPDLPIISIIKEVSKEIIASEPKVVGLNATSDGKTFRRIGIPAIHWGVGTPDNRAHGIDEFINIDDLINLTAAHALVNMEYLGYEKIA
jgi:succinyl-diaminopimelate desuccinylase